MIHLHSTLQFHPVGQGLFATGELHLHDSGPLSRLARAHGPVEEFGDLHFLHKGGEPLARWVFDCGSSSKQSMLDAAIETYTSSLTGTATAAKAHVDLVFLSHFDSDHVNGLTRLLRKITVGTLVLPFVPLWRRLEIAITTSGAKGANLFRFCINPVQFILGVEGASVRRIVFVLPGSQDGDAVEPIARSVPPEDRPHRESVSIRREDLEVEQEDFGARADGSGPIVEWLRPGGRLCVEPLWEFLPYNDEDLAKQVHPAFIAAVAVIKDDILAPGADLEDWRQALRCCYDKLFGPTSRARNAVSLFLWAGPLGTWDRLNALGPPPQSAWAPGGAWGAEGPGVVYTGDGYLDNSTRLADLTTHLGGRSNRIGVIQVMHHGSRHNWHSGVATRLKPKVSVYSSNPKHGRFDHPHPLVQADFSAHGPFQVDAANAWRGELCLMRC